MAESLKFDGNVEALREVFPDAVVSTNPRRGVKVYDAKKGEYVPLNEGQYIVHIGDRFEVADKEPKRAKPAEAPEPESKSESKTDDSGDTATSEGMPE